MSSSSYPLLAARKVYTVSFAVALCAPACSLLGNPSTVPVTSDIAGVTLRTSNPPTTPGVDPVAKPGGYVSVVPTFTPSTSGSTRTVEFSFSGLYLFGGQFIDLSAIAPASALEGRLESVGINIQPGDFSGDPVNPGDYTYASDLSILVATRSGSNPNINNSSATNIRLQVGGTTGFLDGTGPGPERLNFWYPSTDPVTEAIASYTLAGSGITLTSNPNDYAIWLGHGFMTSALTSYSTWGTWTGSVSFNFASSGGSGVPDASRTALLLAPGTLLLLGLAGRARRRG